MCLTREALPSSRSWRDPTTAGESQEEMSDLSQQKDTVDTELRYARAKRAEARRRLDVETAAGHTDEADKWQQEVTDWDARVKSLEAEQNQVDSEVQGAAQQMQPSAPNPEQDLIVPGDDVEIFVVEDPSFNGRYQVRRGGYIILPAVGRIPVAGKTMSGAEGEVRKGAGGFPIAARNGDGGKSGRLGYRKRACHFPVGRVLTTPTPSEFLRGRRRRS